MGIVIVAVASLCLLKENAESQQERGSFYCIENAEGTTT